MSFSVSIRKHRFGIFFWGLVLIRAFFNATLPLMDKTEARYGEIARLMAETGNWVVLQIDYFIPFWAKPPLSTWASASSIWLFGTHEFFVRLPYLLVLIGLGLWLSRYRSSTQHSIYLPGIIVLTLPEMYLHGGVVSTDMFLTLSVCLVMLSFWEALQEKAHTFWGYLFFIGMGFGLLAKGPIIGILTVPPLFLWLLLTKNFKTSLFRLPWISGTMLCLLVSVPWYVWTELRSPGFVDYFIIGEHFNRYFNSAWTGDKYGFPKQQPFGIVWAFLLAAILPWTVLLIKLMIQKFRSIRQNPWLLYLVFWMFWPAVFFTTSKSLIHPYVLPSMVPVALFLVHYWDQVKRKKTYLSIALSLPLLLLLVYTSGMVATVFDDNSDKKLVQVIAIDEPLYALEKKTYSSQFYSHGKIKVLPLDTFIIATQKPSSFSILATHKDWMKIPDSIQKQFRLLGKNKKRGIYQRIE